MFCFNYNVLLFDCFFYFYRFGGILIEIKFLFVILIE